MRSKRIKSLVILLIAALIVTMMPLTASAASKKPGKVKITSFKVSAVSASTNKTTVTIKWKKASNAKKYEIFEQGSDGVWRKLKTVKKSVTKLKITSVPAGQYNIRIRAVNKKKKGKFSAVKGRYIASPLTLEQYIKRFSPSLQSSVYGSFVRTFSGNTIYYTFEVTKHDYFAGMTKDEVIADSYDDLLKYINDSKAGMASDVNNLATSNGIRGGTYVAKCTYNGEQIVP